LLALFLAIVGCSLFSPSADGSWEGTCTRSGYEEFGIELDLEQDGKDLEGEAEISSSGYTTTGDLEGDFDGGEVDVEIQFQSSGYTVEATFEGEVDKDTLEGKLTVVGQGSVHCELER
jgi:hypothetical protein